MGPPKVFASYSHDSDEHKRWVLKLCTQLRVNEIDMILDVWDLQLGDLIHPFMREGIADSDRVLVICTEHYVQKADALEGGVGYEITVANRDLNEDLRTNKFIPIIRQSTGKPKIPKTLGIRNYIDFSNDQEFERKFDELVRAIHGDPLHPKPSVGKRQPANQPSDPETSGHHLLKIPEKVKSASDIYKLAIEFARADNRIDWQQLVERIRLNVRNSLKQLKQENLNSGNLENAEQRIGVVDVAVDIISPLISIALVGIKSQNEHFNNQKSVLDILRSIDGWHHDFRHEYAKGIPNFLGYVYHSLHGSISLHTNQLALALDLARLKVPTFESPESQHDMVWRIRPLIGWSLARCENGRDNWGYLVSAYERWEWLRDVFEDESTYRMSLVAYYMALQIHQLAIEIASDGEANLLDPQDLNVPLFFLFVEKYEIIRGATSLLLRNPAVSELWECEDVNLKRMKNLWEKLIKPWDINQRLYFYESSKERILTKIPSEYVNFFDAL